MSNLPEPISRRDIYQSNLCKGTQINLPGPISRSDLYYDYLCNPTDEKLRNLPKPISRSDEYLYYLCINGTVGGKQAISIDIAKLVESIPEGAEIGEMYAVIKKEA